MAFCTTFDIGGISSANLECVFTHLYCLHLILSALLHAHLFIVHGPLHKITNVVGKIIRYSTGYLRFFLQRSCSQITCFNSNSYLLIMMLPVPCVSCNNGLTKSTLHTWQLIDLVLLKIWHRREKWSQHGNLLDILVSWEMPYSPIGPTLATQENEDCAKTHWRNSWGQTYIMQDIHRNMYIPSSTTCYLMDVSDTVYWHNHTAVNSPHLQVSQSAGFHLVICMSSCPW